MNININSSIKISLTPNGLDIYNQYLKNLNQPPVGKIFILETELCEFANIFGKHLYNGNPKAPLFENNSFTITQIR